MNNNHNLAREHKPSDSTDYQKNLSYAIEKIKNSCPNEWETVLNHIAAMTQMPMLTKDMTDSFICRLAAGRESLVSLYKRLAK